MKKHILSIIALVCAVAALAISIASYACVTRFTQTDTIESIAQNPTLAATPTTPEMEPYCALLVRDWSAEDGALSVSSLYVDVMLPENTTCQDARLTLYRFDEELTRQTLTLAPGEAQNALNFDGSFSDIRLPELEDDDELTLWLELELSDGTTMQSCGAQWFMEDGQLMLIAG